MAAQPLSSPPRSDRTLLADPATRSCGLYTSAQPGRGILTATKQHVARWLLVAVSSVNRLIRHRRPCCVLVTGTNKRAPEHTHCRPLHCNRIQVADYVIMGRERDAVYPPRVVPPTSVSAPHTPHTHNSGQHPVLKKIKIKIKIKNKKQSTTLNPKLNPGWAGYLLRPLRHLAAGAGATQAQMRGKG
jgi:hypothetical protein